jgi:predicted transcriptional regulator
MTLTISLPDDLASRLEALLPEAERTSFAVSAIAEALRAREQESAECSVAVEGGLAELEAGRTVSLEDEVERWQRQRSALLAEAPARKP